MLCKVIYRLSRPATPLWIIRSGPRCLTSCTSAGTVATSTEAARVLGQSSGLCSFHLRQLARYGYLKEAEHGRGRVRPWRLASTGPQVTDDEGFAVLARELEDEGYRRWSFAGKPGVAPQWQRDAAFSTVLHLTAAELSRQAGEIRAVLDRYRQQADPSRPGTRPVAAVTRLFPLLPAILLAEPFSSVPGTWTVHARMEKAQFVTR